MSSINRLTNNSDETDIASLISKDNIFSIPFFQRPYKWKPERIKQLQEDILALVDETSDFHFLGAVIIHGRRTNPADPDIFDVIDGQQRMTTIFLFLCATVKFLCEIENHDEAVGIFQKYIAINRNISNLSNLRLHSCKEDRTQLNSVIRELLTDKVFLEKLGSFKFKPLPIAASTKNRGPLRNNYNNLLRFIRFEYSEGDIDRVRTIYECLLNKVSVVQIDVKDPASGPTIFDSLNSRQEPMTIGDLVRNAIFSKVANQDPNEIEEIDRETWQPFYKNFGHENKNHFDAYFFPYGLIQNPNLKKSDVFNSLQKQWASEEDPTQIIEELSLYQAPFMDLVCGTNLTKHSTKIAKGFARLYALGMPSSVLPFLMQLSKECREGRIEDVTCEEIQSVIESFLVRRATCGIEPTGLHAVFKRLWRDIRNEVSANNVKKSISIHKTVKWPSDAEFEQSIRERPLYGASITKFLLSEYDISLNGDVPNDKWWIEHVLPQNPDPRWFEKIKKHDHEIVKDLLANLIPLSKEMNNDLKNKPYADKVDIYKKDSMFKTTREFASDYSDWNLEAIQSRSSELAKWAISRWKQTSNN